ncbi:helix-turn-helix domain-containing protein [Methylobacterium sp. E-041]|uniref:helix-turn-helix domain-containing protein n=1 Tax=Methylobacterium sp. E-041 TaxID=2836573 RepID=UPI002445314D|nr:helix-turn-helix domain-containing protein [Methylobacterium sp. E-041]
MGSEILAVLDEPTVDLLVAGRILGIGRSATYRARKAGEIPVVKVGRQYRVPTERLREMLGLPSGASALQAPIAA